MQLAVGVEFAISGMIAALGKDIVKEYDLAICDTAVGGTLNFTFVYLLTAVAPAVASGQLYRKSRDCAAASVAPDTMTGRFGVTAGTAMIGAFEDGLRIRERAKLVPIQRFRISPKGPPTWRSSYGADGRHLSPISHRR